MLGLGSRAQSAAGVRPPRAPASAPHTAAAGKDPWIRRAVTGELPGPHAPSALLELSSLDPGLGARAQGEWRAASIARGSRRTRTEKRSGWDSASVGHLVCLVQTCVKGPLCYVMLCYVPAAKPAAPAILDCHPASPRLDPVPICMTQPGARRLDPASTQAPSGWWMRWVDRLDGWVAGWLEGGLRARWLDGWMAGEPE